MRLDRFDYFVWTIYLLLILGIAGVVWHGNQLGIQVSATWPADGEETGALNPVVILFPEPMDPNSLKPRFSLSPEVPGKAEVSGDQMVFMPETPLEYGRVYTATLLAGGAAASGREIKDDYHWSFTIRQPWITYLGHDDNELYRIPLQGGEPEQLTENEGVFSFAPSLDGEKIAYAVINEQQGIDLWVMARDGRGKNKLLDCGLDRCTSLAWSPDGHQIAYSRSEAGLGPDQPYSASRIWLADTDSGDTTRLFLNPEKTGHSPNWSPDGNRLAYVDGVAGRIVVVEIESGIEIYIPTQTGRMGSWAPDSSRMVYSDFVATEDGVREAVLQVDFNTNDIINLFGHRPNESSFSGPEWSPTNQWIAVKARDVGTVKDSLMLMAYGGDYGFVYAGDEGFSYLNYRYDPTGRYIVYQRAELGIAYAIPDIILYDEEKKQSTFVVSGGSFPAWLP
jgi:Tol biopolymer transport system component